MTSSFINFPCKLQFQLTQIQGKLKCLVCKPTHQLKTFSSLSEKNPLNISRAWFKLFVLLKWTIWRILIKHTAQIIVPVVKTLFASCLRLLGCGMLSSVLNIYGGNLQQSSMSLGIGIELVFWWKWHYETVIGYGIHLTNFPLNSV